MRSSVKSRSRAISSGTRSVRSSGVRVKGCAAKFLYDRYVGNDPEQVAAYEEEILNAEIARRIFDMSNYDWVFWLNLTNIALGVVVVLAVLVVAYGVVWELVIRHRKHREVRNLDAEVRTMLHEEFAHKLPVPELGLTMADGGEHVKEAPKKPLDGQKSS